MQSRTPVEAGLCADCRYLRIIRNDRGSVFYQCGKWFEEPRFAKYPRLPVRECPAHAPASPRQE